VKRFLPLLLVLLSLPVCTIAQETTPQGAEIQWEPLVMRSTSAASVARNAFWPSAKGSSGFADSIVFRRGVDTRTVYDTTMGYHASYFRFPPTFGQVLQNALVDTTTTPWLMVRVRQDTLQYGGTTITSGLDSVRVGAQVSPDGINWTSVSGTPTQRFDTVFMTSGQDGVQAATLIGVEDNPGADLASVKLSCHPSQAAVDDHIINRTLCLCGQYIRFIIGGGYSGQFVVEAGRWVR